MKTEYGRFYWCDTCDDGIEYDTAGIKNHLKEKHGVTETKGVRKLITHMDGRDFFISKYEILISGPGGVQLQMESINKRTGEDAEYWK